MESEERIFRNDLCQGMEQFENDVDLTFQFLAWMGIGVEGDEPEDDQ